MRTLQRITDHIFPANFGHNLTVDEKHRLLRALFWIGSVLTAFTMGGWVGLLAG